MLSLDTTLFNFINQSLSNPFFDAVLPWLREKWFWSPLYLFVTLVAIWNWKWKGLMVPVSMLICLMLSDGVSSKLMKPTFARERPCREAALENKVIRRVSCGPGYSFTSSHATNHFAIATLWIGLFGSFNQRLKWFAWLWAGSVAFTQVYVGVHYPGDVIAGGLMGIVIGKLLLFALNRIYRFTSPN